jgi:hypothetical protein
MHDTGRQTPPLITGNRDVLAEFPERAIAKPHNVWV